MYRAVIFFFSGTGNTWWVADRIKKQLDANNINADTVSMESVGAKKADWWIRAADLVLIGWPVHFSDIPEPVRRFIEGLNVVEKGKHIHTFCTQSSFSGDGAWFCHRLFKSRGLIIDSAAHFIMPSNRRDSARHAEEILARCERQVERYAERLLSGKARIQGRYSWPLGICQRAPFHLFSRSRKSPVSADAQKCTGCGLCAPLCPMQNITVTDNRPEFADRCTLCQRCRSCCPVGAIAIQGASGAPYSLHDKRFKPSCLK